MKNKKKILLICLLGLLISPAIISANTYINWSSEYYVNYPDNWYQVSYGTADFFLTNQNVDPTTYNYDVVLAQSGDPAFFNMPYAFLHSQLVGELSNKEIDSVLNSLSKDYGNEWSSGSLKDVNRNLGMERPIYDRSMKAVAIKSRITSDVTDKYLIEIRKFFKNGVFILLGYSPIDSLAEAQKVYLQMLNSFSDQNLDAVAPKDSFKVVDVSKREAAKYNEEEFPQPGAEKGISDNTKRIIYIVVLVIIVGAVIAAIFMKKKKSQDNIDN
jgi:hypothetical protein